MGSGRLLKVLWKFEGFFGIRLETYNGFGGDLY